MHRHSECVRIHYCVSHTAGPSAIHCCVLLCCRCYCCWAAGSTANACARQALSFRFELVCTSWRGYVSVVPRCGVAKVAFLHVSFATPRQTTKPLAGRGLGEKCLRRHSVGWMTGSLRLVWYGVCVHVCMICTCVLNACAGGSNRQNHRANGERATRGLNG